MLYGAAIQTLNAAILSSEDPDEWMEPRGKPQAFRRKIRGGMVASN